ncbi:MAG: tol-pal system protein YbgF [Candidatus Cloacimonetes bacterium]|nr:tol-pal system protein YbgF [Candidatus Cloacimonadota bacterium]MBL7085505.1 tol-pal system protein YbgF [Candidatus Cloacimonadota bacterium]
MKILSVILSIFSIILVQCSQVNKYQKLCSSVENNELKIDSLSAVSKGNSNTMKEIKSEYDEKINIINDKLLAIEILQSKILLLESKINNINQEIKAQEQILTELQNKDSTDIAQYSTLQELSPERLYQDARDFFIDGKYQNSITKFSQIVKDYPDNSLAPNSQYWIGECYYSLEQFETAIQHFDKVVNNYPNSEQVIDAKFKIALCLADMKEYEGALAQLREIQKQYPNYERIKLVKEKIIIIENR